MRENPRYAFWLGLLLGALGGGLVTFTVLWWTGLAGAWGIGPAARPAVPAAVAPSMTPGAVISGAPTALPPPAAVGRSASDVVVGLSQDYLTRLVRENLPADAPLEPGVQVSIDEGSAITLDGKVNVSLGPFTTQVPARTRVGVQPTDGRIGLSLNKVEVGPLPIPEQLLPNTLRGLLGQVESGLNAKLFGSAAFRDMKTQSVRSDRGRLWIEFDDGR